MHRRSSQAQGLCADSLERSARAARETKVLARNKFEGNDSDFNVTPAISNNEFLLRLIRWRYCVGEAKT